MDKQDKQRLQKLAGIVLTEMHHEEEGEYEEERLGNEYELGATDEEGEYEEENEDSGFRQAIATIADDLVRGVNLLGIQRGEVTADDVADELLQGRWREMLKDQIVDRLATKNS